MSEEVKQILKKHFKKTLKIITIIVLIGILIASLFVGTVKKMFDNVSEVFNDVLDKTIEEIYEASVKNEK